MIKKILGALSKGVLAIGSLLGLTWGGSIAVEQVKERAINPEREIVSIERMIDWHGSNTLKDALEKEGSQVIEIKMGTNYGGYVKAYEDMRERVRKSKKVVYSSCGKFCASASAMTLYIGDFVKIDKKATILFHAVRYRERFGQLRVPNWDKLETPMDKTTFKLTLMMLERIRSQVTVQEWFDMLSGKDVKIEGAELCKRNTVVLENDQFCIFKGNKHNKEFDWSIFKDENKVTKPSPRTYP